MRKLEVDVPKSYDLSKVSKLIEQLCTEEGLTQKLRSTLKGYSRSTHWHYKKEFEKGTLEVTFIPKESKILFSVHDNRKARWTDGSADSLALATRGAFESKRKSRPFQASTQLRGF